MIKTEIVCNHCGCVGSASHNIKELPAHVLRTNLKLEKGWRVGLPGGMDICNKCWPVMKIYNIKVR